MGLKLAKDWTEHDHADTKAAEYQADGGSFLELVISRYKNGKVKVTPYEKKTENLQISKSDFSLVAEAAEALYPQFGPFTLALPALGLDIEINDSKGIEEVMEKNIIEALKRGKIYLF